MATAPIPLPGDPPRFGARPLADRSSVAATWVFSTVIFLIALLGIALVSYGGTMDDVLPAKASELFETTKVWELHLKFTPEQWAQMEPEEIPPPPRRPAFGAGMTLAPTLLHDGDANRDRRLSADELRALAGRWFEAWDEDRDGTLDPKQIRAGLKAALAAAGVGDPGGGMPGLNLIGERGKRNGVSVMLGLDYPYAHADLEFAGRTFADVAVRYKGNGTFMESRDSLKRPLKIDLNKYVKGQKLAGVTTLNLHNNVTDAGLMNEVIAHQLYRDAGVPAPRTAYARVFVTVPGTHDRKFFGLYSLVENVDKHFVADHDLGQGGAILKPCTPDVFTDLGDDWSAYEQIYDPKTDLTAAELRRFLEFCRLVTDADDAEYARRLGEFVDLDEFARFLAVTAWIGDLDGILTVGQNYYVHLDPTSGRFRFIPWDRDHTFGSWGGRDYAERVQHSVRQPWQGRKRFLERSFAVPAFRDRYLAALAGFAQQQARPEQIAARAATLAAAIRPAVAEESADKLARFDAVLAGKPAPSAGRFSFGGPTPPMLVFVKERAAAVDAQLAGKSEGQVLGRPRPGDRRPPEFKPEELLEPALMTALDVNQDRTLDREELVGGFARWFATWAGDDAGALLAVDRLRDGLNTAVPLRPGGPRPR